MNKFGGLLISSLLALTGCASAAPPEPVAVTAAPPAVKTMVEKVREAKIYFGKSDAEINHEGSLICIGFTEKISDYEQQIEIQVLLKDLTRKQAEIVIYAAVEEFCPEEAFNV